MLDEIGLVISPQYISKTFARVYRTVLRTLIRRSKIHNFKHPGYLLGTGIAQFILETFLPAAQPIMEISK